MAGTATPAQMAQQLQELATAFGTSQAQLAEARQGLSQQMQVINELQQRLISTNGALVDTRNRLEGVEAARGEDGGSLIDTKGISKPSVFTSDDPRKFPDWSFKFSNFVADRFEAREVALEWAKAQ